jgi:hypothetical protein
MLLKLTAEQAAQVSQQMEPGRAILGRIMWQPFNGDVSQCGTLVLDYGFVEERTLPALRAAITEARQPAKPVRRGKRVKAVTGEPAA